MNAAVERTVTVAKEYADSFISAQVEFFGSLDDVDYAALRFLAEQHSISELIERSLACRRDGTIKAAQMHAFAAAMKVILEVGGE